MCASNEDKDEMLSCSEYVSMTVTDSRSKLQKHCQCNAHDPVVM